MTSIQRKTIDFVQQSNMVLSVKAAEWLEGKLKIWDDKHPRDKPKQTPKTPSEAGKKAPQTPKADPKTPKPDTNTPKPDTKTPKPETKTPKPDAKKPETKTPKPDTTTPKRKGTTTDKTPKKKIAVAEPSGTLHTEAKVATPKTGSVPLLLRLLQFSKIAFLFRCH